MEKYFLRFVCMHKFIHSYTYKFMNILKFVCVHVCLCVFSI